MPSKAKFSHLPLLSAVPLRELSCQILRYGVYYRVQLSLVLGTGFGTHQSGGDGGCSEADEGRNFKWEGREGEALQQEAESKTRSSLKAVVLV